MSTPPLPATLSVGGGLYTLAVHPDELVQLNAEIPCRVREAVRAHAAANGLLLRDVVEAALCEYLAAASS